MNQFYLDVATVKKRILTLSLLLLLTALGLFYNSYYLISGIEASFRVSDCPALLVPGEGVTPAGVDEIFKNDAWKKHLDDDFNDLTKAVFRDRTLRFVPDSGCRSPEGAARVICEKFVSAVLKDCDYRQVLFQKTRAGYFASYLWELKDMGEPGHSLSVLIIPETNEIFWMRCD